MAERLVTEADIAKALGVSLQAVNKRAARGRKDRKGQVIEQPWPVHSRRKEKNGNETKLYAFATLPLDVRGPLDRAAHDRAAVQAPSGCSLVAVSNAIAGMPPPPTSIAPTAQTSVLVKGGLHRKARKDAGLTDKQRAQRDGTLILCRAIDDAILAADCSVKTACRELASRIINKTAHQELIDASIVTYVKPRANGQTVDSLTSRLQKMFPLYLAGCEADDPGLYLVPGAPEPVGQKPEDIRAFLRHYCKPSRPSVTMAWKNAEGWYTEHNLHYPAVDTFYRIETSLPVTVKNHGRMTGAAFTALKPYIARDVSMFKANDIWVGDGHTFKARVRHPLTGKPFRPEITMILDWVSRKIVGWSVDLAESTIAVSAAFRHAQLKTRARPLLYYSDKGSGQTGKQIDHPITGTLARQGICHETGRPGHPQARGIIERLWASTVIPLAKTYPTVMTKDADRDHVRRTGRELDRAERAGEVSGLVPHWQDFIRDLEQVVARYNASHEHSGLGYATPDAAYAAKLDPNSIVFGVDDVEIEALWLPEEIRTPERGLVSLFNNRYYRADLVDRLAESEQVRVRFDIHDPQTVWLYRMDGSALGAATWDGHKRAAFPVPFIEAKRQERIDGQVALKQRDIARIEEERGATYAVPTAAVQDFGGRLVTDAEAVEIGARLLAQDAERQARAEADKPRDPTGPELADRFEAIQARQAAGESVTEEEIEWAKNIHRSAKFRAEMKRREEHATGRRAAA